MHYGSLDINEYIIDKIYELVPNIHRSGDKMNFSCPVCGDGKKRRTRRGWYYLTSNSYKCYNDGCDANFGMSGVYFVAYLQGMCVSDVRNEFYRSGKDVKTKVQEAQKRDRRKQKPVEIIEDGDRERVTIYDIPEEWDRVELNEGALQILNDRLILNAPFIPPKWKPYYNTRINRIVLPWTVSGDMSYYQSMKINRSVDDDSPKYLFPPGIGRPCFNLDQVDMIHGVMFLLEGLIDTMFVVNGVCVGSVNMSTDQITTLGKSFIEKVWCPDNQYNDKAAYNSSITYLDRNRNGAIFIWDEVDIEYGDINEYVCARGLENNKFADIEYMKGRVFRGLSARLELQKVRRKSDWTKKKMGVVRDGRSNRKNKN